jgi:hypothetical protein
MGVLNQYFIYIYKKNEFYFINNSNEQNRDYNWKHMLELS